MLSGKESSAPNSDSQRTAEIWVTMKIIPVVTAMGILGTAYGALFCGALMTTNVVVFGETWMVVLGETFKISSRAHSDIA